MRTGAAAPAPAGIRASARAARRAKGPGARPLALTLDLDDTLWPVQPALEAADRETAAWLARHYPEVAANWPASALMAERERIGGLRPELAHDFSALRRLALERAFAAHGVVDAPIDTLWEIYFAARNRVTLYADSADALARLARRAPIASLTNGNADLDRTGVRRYFTYHVCARDLGCGKPNPRIFAAAAQRLGLAPADILHVGDDPLLDVAGARAAGFRAAWINRGHRPWPAAAGPAPALEFAGLGAFADWLDGRFDAAG